MHPELLTIPQLCKTLNIGTTYCYELIKNKRISAVKLGKKTLIKRSEMERFISELDQYLDSQDITATTKPL